MRDLGRPSELGTEAMEQQAAMLRRAHRMGCSDPNDPSRRTTYGDAADTIAFLLQRVRELEAGRGPGDAAHM